MARKPSKLKDKWLNNHQLAFARNALRRASYKWPDRNEARRAARLERGIYRCNQCLQPFPLRDTQLDHVEPVVRVSGKNQSLGEFAGRLFVYKTGWQVLCTGCHGAKTLRENTTR